MDPEGEERGSCCISSGSYTVWKGKKDLWTKKTIFFENYHLIPLDMY